MSVIKGHRKNLISTILFLGILFSFNRINSQEKPMNHNIHIVVGSYKYYRNAVILHKKLIKEGFKDAKILKRTKGFFRVSLIQKSSRLEIDEFIKANNLKQNDFWLFHSNQSISGKKNPFKKEETSPSKTIKQNPKENKISLKKASLKKNIFDTTIDTIPLNRPISVIEKIMPALEETTKPDKIREEYKSQVKILDQDTAVIKIPTGFRLENKNTVYLPKLKPEKNNKVDSLSNIVEQKLKPRENNIFIAKSNYEDYNFSPAISKYLKLARSGKQSKEIYEYLAMAYFNNSQYDLAANWFNKLIDGYPEGLDPEMYFRASISFKSIQAYDVSDLFMKKYIEIKNSPLSNQYINISSNYLDSVLKNSNRYSLYETKINSINSDFGPNFYDDDRIIFASSKEATGNKKFKWSDEPFLDLFIAKIDSAGYLYDREPLKGDINTKYHESTATISKDGNTMYFTRNNYFKGRLKSARDNEVKLKIYKATKQNDSWGSIEELPFNGDQYSTAHPALSPDNDKLYFSSDMPGSYGKSDIWFVYIFENGEYSQPINVGPNVNTEFRESFPFLDKENNLYYSSDGKLGLGGFDVFSSKLNNRGYPQSSINLGMPVNSAFDDFGYVYNQMKNFGYISSNRDGLNGSSSDQVYKIVKNNNTNYLNNGLEENICEFILEGKVYDTFTRELLIGAKVQLLNSNKNIISNYTVDENGNYKIDEDVNCSDSYYLRVSNGISYNTREIEIDFTQKGKVYENIDLKWTSNCLPDDLICVLGVEPIYFELNKSTLKKNSVLSLNKVLVALFKYPDMILQIRSYADSRASKEYNKKLSLRRANVTKQWLVNRGVNSNRLLIQAIGEENKDNICKGDANCSEAEYQLNRKSTFKILKF
jgi:outer membrane protein OmpA-like peptidoglycan-associated protein